MQTTKIQTYCTTFVVLLLPLLLLLLLTPPPATWPCTTCNSNSTSRLWFKTCFLKSTSKNFKTQTITLTFVCDKLDYFMDRRTLSNIIVIKLPFLANVNSSSCSLYVVVRPSSVVCLSSVCNVRAPYSDDWNFRQCFYAVGYLGHLLTSR